MNNNKEEEEPETLVTEQRLLGKKIPQVNRFVPNKSPMIKLNSTITIYGKRGTGKSFFIRWILIKAFQDYIPWGWCFTKTKHNYQYQITMPDKYIIKNFNADILSDIMKRQKKARETFEKPDSDFNPLAFVIWDDYMGNDIKFNDMLTEYYCLGRHYGTINFYGAQKLTITPPVIRENTDIVVLFNSDAKRHLDGLSEDFAGKMRKSDFIEWVSEYVEQERVFFLIDNNPNTPPDKKYYYGKAEYLPVGLDNIMGCQEYWKGSEKQLTEIEDGSIEEKRIRWEQLVEPWNIDKTVQDKNLSSKNKK